MNSSRTSNKKAIVRLSPKQYDFVSSPDRFTGFVGGRGAGKSYAGSWKLLRKAKPGRFYMIAAPTYKMLDDSSLRMFEKVARETRRLVRMKRARGDASALIKTDSGGIAEVIFRSAENPETLRGPNLSGCWFDEASLMKAEAFDITIACLREGGEVGWLASTFTPKGRSNWTYKTFVEKPMPSMSLFHSPTADNVFNVAEYEEMMRARYTADKARQELGGLFIDNDKQLISYDMMMSCTDENCLWKNDQRAVGPLYVGWDLGRSRHRSVIWTWELVGDVAYCRECFVMHKTSFEVQIQEVRKRVHRPNVARFALDAGVSGLPYADEFKRTMGMRFEPLNLSGPMQGMLATYMQFAFEKRAVRIPDDDMIRDDFSLVETPNEQSGKAVMGKEQVHETDELGHADRFWAAAIAYKAIHERRVPAVWNPINMPRVVK